MITQEELMEVVNYDEVTGVFIWKERPLHLFKTPKSGKMWNGKFAGKQAGCISHRRSYVTRVIRIKNKDYYAHRLAWIYMTGEQPPEQIDHKDRNSLNNAWDNLRDGTYINNKNLSMNKSNTSGVTGVYWNQNLSKWVAFSGHEGKVVYLGLYHDIEEAEKVVVDFRKSVGYDDDHGTPKPNINQTLNDLTALAQETGQYDEY